MGKAVRSVLLMKESHYSINPPSGKVVCRYDSELRLKELPLVPSTEIDERIPYLFLNPLQSLFFYAYQGGSSLVCAPTSAGKSLIAYLFMKDKKGRKVYVAPTKSLVYEKAIEFKKYYRNVNVRTGDRLLENYKEPTGDVIVSTYENLAYAFRNRSSWVNSVHCLVVDEVHQMTKRWVLEEAITYALRRDIPILGLSATLPDASSIAQWLDINLLVQSEWRPTELIRDVKLLKEFNKVRKKKGREYALPAKLLGCMFEIPQYDEKVILFVPSKKIGWKLLELAKEEKIGIMNRTLPFEVEEREEKEIAFHNADVPKEEREEIEEAFRNGKLKRLIATQTLAYGVNLPADRVLVLVRMFWERGKLRILPDALDIIQMEGRAGRLGIKPLGYSNLLLYGGDKDSFERCIKETFDTSLRRMIKEEKNLDILCLLLLIGMLYEQKNYEGFIRKTYSYSDVSNKEIERAMSFLTNHGYLNGYELTEKALYCIRSGIPPTKFEEFLIRLSLGLDHLVITRPLLHMKKFDSLYDFVKGGESFEEDRYHVAKKLIPCGELCFKDNTDQFIFYIEGLTFKYPNIKNPPGEFSYLATDALHLVRMLIELRKLKLWNLSTMDILHIAHSVKYGVDPRYSSLCGIKGIGHIRANLLKRFMQSQGKQAPPLGSKVEELLNTFEEEALEQILIEDRKLDRKRAQEEVKRVINVLERNSKGFLIDDRILLAFGLFSMGDVAYRMRKEELLKNIIWS
ncbi:MAG: DEAD/DEAH box helicase [Aquificaceae bacterium]